MQDLLADPVTFTVLVVLVLGLVLAHNLVGRRLASSAARDQMIVSDMWLEELAHQREIGQQVMEGASSEDRHFRESVLAWSSRQREGSQTELAELRVQNDRLLELALQRGGVHQAGIARVVNPTSEHFGDDETPGFPLGMVEDPRPVEDQNGSARAYFENTPGAGPLPFDGATALGSDVPETLYTPPEIPTHG